MREHDPFSSAERLRRSRNIFDPAHAQESSTTTVLPAPTATLFHALHIPLARKEDAFAVHLVTLCSIGFHCHAACNPCLQPAPSRRPGTRNLRFASLQRALCRPRAYKRETILNIFATPCAVEVGSLLQLSISRPTQHPYCQLYIISQDCVANRRAALAGTGL